MSIQRSGFPKMEDYQQVSMEMETMTRPSVMHMTLPSSSGTVSPIFSSSSGFPTNLHFSSVLPSENQSRSSSFFSQSSTNRASFDFAESPDSRIFQSTPSSHYIVESHHASWCADSLPAFLDFPVTIPINQTGTSICNGLMASEDLSKRNDWQEWADELITDDNALSSSWNEHLVDSNVTDLKPKIPYKEHKPSLNYSANHPQVHHQLPTSPGETPSSSASSVLGKPRMRWTPEHHEAFLEAINKLGGSERATPKGVLKLMKVEGLTIYHIKSHLQKYRTARYRPDSAEGSSEKRFPPMEEISSLDLKTGIVINEALRLQMEVQKRLHEQLEIQRNLQLKIEEQGRTLQMMFEKQCKSGFDKLKAPSSFLETLPDFTTDVLQTSPKESEKQASQAGKCKNGKVTQKSPEITGLKNLEPDVGCISSSLPPSKRSRTEKAEKGSTEVALI